MAKLIIYQRERRGRIGMGRMMPMPIVEWLAENPNKKGEMAESH